MPPIENNTTKTKADSLSAIFRNPNLAKSIDQALQSPVNSTKRQQARATVASLNRANGIQENASGEFEGIIPWAGKQVAGFGKEVLGAATGAVDVMGNKIIPNVADAVLNVGAYTAGKAEQAASGFGQTLLGPSMSRPKTAFEDTAGSKLMDLYSPVSQYGQSLEKKTVPLRGLKRPQSPTAQTKYPTSPAATLPGTETADSKLKDIYDKEGIEGLGKYLSSVKKSETGAVTTPPYGMNEEGLQRWADENPAEFDSWATQMGWGAGATTGEDVGTTSVSSKYPMLTEAVNAGIGANTFAYQAMNDINVLKELFPGVPEDDLPVGASISRQVADLDTTLKGEYNLVEQLNNLNSLKERGLTITDDLQAYIRGKDEYTERIDTMIDSAKKTMVGQDMSNPNTSNRMGKYLDYLTVLKGRQNQRYTDFVNTSIDRHNSEITAAQDAYNSSQTNYLDKLKTLSTIKLEDYTTMKGMLENMYTNLAGQEEAELNNYILQNKALESYYDMAESVSSIGSEEIEPLKSGEHEYYQRQIGMSADGEELDGVIKSADLYGLLEGASRDGYSQERMKSYFFKNAQAEAYNNAKSGNVSKTMDFYGKTFLDMAERAKQSSGEPTTLLDIQDPYRTDITSLLNIVGTNLSSGLDSYFSDAKEGIDRVNSIRKILEDLTGKGLFNKQKDFSEDTKDKIVNKYKDDIDSGLIESIFESYKTNLGAGIEAEDFYNKKMSNETVVDQLLSNVIGSWSDSLVTSINDHLMQ